MPNIQYKRKGGHMLNWIIKLFGNYCDTTTVNRGSFKGKYDVYYFLGKYHEIKRKE